MFRAAVILMIGVDAEAACHGSLVEAADGEAAVEVAGQVVVAEVLVASEVAEVSAEVALLADGRKRQKM